MIPAITAAAGVLAVAAAVARPRHLGRERHRVLARSRVVRPLLTRIEDWSPIRGALDRRAITAGLPELVESLARSVRSGSSVRGAISGAAASIDGPLGDDVRSLKRQLDNGAPLPEALDRWRQHRVALRDVGLVTVALTIAAGSGGSVARALDGVADTIRGEQHLRAEVRALASQAEASALLIALLPIAFGFFAGIADPRTIAFLTTQPVGIACLVAGLSLDLGAFWWMRRITAGIEA